MCYDMPRFLIAFLFALIPSVGMSQRTVVSLNAGWRFAYGHATDVRRDFGCGTEYFNYLTKAASIHNAGPYSPKFDDSGWESICLPHDYAAQQPYEAEASHSHGYRTVGWQYPATSVGWYRRTFELPDSLRGRNVALCFGGIFRDSRVWVNGFYCGGEESGYLPQEYDITDYLNPDGTNVVTVRSDATLEEGWYYEGAGIYRSTWLEVRPPLHFVCDGHDMVADFSSDGTFLGLKLTAEVRNAAHDAAVVGVEWRILDAEGRPVAMARSASLCIAPQTVAGFAAEVSWKNEPRWSPADPYLYTVECRTVTPSGDSSGDATSHRYGIRHVVFDADRGLVLNGEALKIQGVNMHQDHAGVGVAVPDGLHLWRLRQLKAMGVNTYRSSHHPAPDVVLDMCDSLGIMVVDENRLAGVSDPQLHVLRTMIRRHRCHPSIILWSVGNEEWGIEWDPRGEAIARTLTEVCHSMDPSRAVTFATSSGPTVEVPVDVAGYNYIMQNLVEELRGKYPGRKCFGSEETTGCGSRGVYVNASDGSMMAALNRCPDEKDGMLNRIERGWQFYATRPWAAGCCFWTGFDYGGEPNPLKWPAVSSEFGILDYCGFPKDEAYYLRAWWTPEPVVHLLPHWSLDGCEGDSVNVWVYGNAAEVELFLNGRSLGRKAMPRYGHLEWRTVYRPGRLWAVGYDERGRRIATDEVVTAGKAATFRCDVQNSEEVCVVNVSLFDTKGRPAPTACDTLHFALEGDVRLLGSGNGSPSHHNVSPCQSARQGSVPAFNGKAQILLLRKDRNTHTLHTTESAVAATLTVWGEGLGRQEIRLR